MRDVICPSGPPSMESAFYCKGPTLRYVPYRARRIAMRPLTYVRKGAGTAREASGRYLMSVDATARIAGLLRTGTFASEKVTTLVADWNDAPEALLARTTKVVVQRNARQGTPGSVQYRTGAGSVP